MDSRTLQLLEFPKVLAVLAGFAASEPGSRACVEILPLSDPETVRRQGILLAQGLEWAEDSGFKVSSFPDLDGLFSFAEDERRDLDLDGLFALSQVLGQAREARQALEERKNQAHLADFVEHMAGFEWPERLQAALSRCIDQDGRIRDEASPELYAVRGEIRSIHQKCTKKAKDFILSHNLADYLQDDYITLSSDRYVLPLMANFKGKFQGIIHDYSQTGETCYFEPLFLVELNNRLQELKKDEAYEERRIAAYLTGLYRDEEEAVRSAYGFLVELDVVLAKAGLAAALDGRPLVPAQVPADGEEGGIRLMQARHPLLALSSTKNEAKPVDIDLPPGKRALIISGGNAGGKTVCLKTLGLITLMATSGLPVPVAEGSRLPAARKLFVIMGDEQSLEDHVSTFTAQIRSLVRIWDAVDQDTLFLLDEFGAGTDPAQGAALAQAVIDSILEQGALVVAATHFPALKAYGLAAPRVRSASVLFDPKTKEPLYSLAYDQVGASIALDVARAGGLPPEILARAEQNLLLDGSDTAVLMDRLNSLAVSREEQIRSLQAEKTRLVKVRKGLDERFEKERLKVLKDIQARAQDVVREWQKDKISRKQVQKKLSLAREELAGQAPGAVSEEQEQILRIEELSSGDAVRYVSWDKTGQVMDTDEKRGRVKVDLDGVAMWVDASELAPATASRTAAPKGPAIGKSAAPAKGEPMVLTLDLRGLRADESVSELARFLDGALLKGANRVEVVHGRGTGALRREVHDFLSTFPGVEGFALADEDRGGDGMTEITLK